jgi:NB-ARC domain-containing protein
MMSDDDFLDIDALIERSSFGTPAAKRRRASTPETIARAITQQAQDIYQAERQEEPAHQQADELLVEPFMGEVPKHSHDHQSSLPAPSSPRVEAGTSIGKPGSVQPILDRPIGAPGRQTQWEPTTRQLEPPPSDFVGRSAQLGEAMRILRSRKAGAPVVLVTGQAGVGKTAFARTVAGLLSEDDPTDVHLEVHLSDEGHPPKSAEDALAELLLNLGVEEKEIKPGVDARRRRYLIELQNKRALVMIDGAVDETQVRPLLPPRGSAAIITSRLQLTELLADGARPIRLRPLTRTQALHLLARQVGRDRVMSDLAAAMGIVNACGRLPLALVTVAGRLRTASGEHLPLRVVGNRLQNERARLDQTTVGSRSVAAALATSYKLLTKERRHVFHVVGLLAAPEVDAEVVAASAKLSVATATLRLGELVSASLLEVMGSPGERWRMHNLVRQYASQVATTHLTPEEQQAVVGRALQVYLRRGSSLRNLARSDAMRLTPSLIGPLRTQLNRDGPSLTALLNQAVSLQVNLVAWASQEMLDLLPEIAAWLETPRAFEVILMAARQGHDPKLEAYALYGLGRDHARRGDLDRARRLLSRALSLAEQVDDRGLTEAIGHAFQNLDDEPYPRWGRPPRVLGSLVGLDAPGGQPQAEVPGPPSEKSEDPSKPHRPSSLAERGIAPTSGVRRIMLGVARGRGAQRALPHPVMWGC